MTHIIASMNVKEDVTGTQVSGGRTDSVDGLKVESNGIIWGRPLAAGVTSLPGKDIKDGLGRGPDGKVPNYVNLSLDPKHPHKDQGMKAHAYYPSIGEEK